MILIRQQTQPGSVIAEEDTELWSFPAQEAGAHRALSIYEKEQWRHSAMREYL